MDIISYMKRFRKYIAGVDTMVPLHSGRMATAINFDNAATTPPFVSVINEIVRFAPWYSSVHRGAGFKSKLCSDIFEKSRYNILDFVNADKEKDTVIFIKNTTEAINKLSYRLCNNHEKCVVLSTMMEHHSNDLPWRGKFKLDYISIDKSGRLSIEDLKRKLAQYDGNVKLVTVAGASNVTGFINPIHEIAAEAHKYNAFVCVDGAQLIPHKQIDMTYKDDGYIDFLAFSAHKMYAPFGIGVLVGPKKAFEEGDPDYSGGGTVKIVTPYDVKWDVPPHKEEAGSPNLMGVVALNSAIRTLKGVGMKNIEAYERYLTGYALQGLKTVPGIILYNGDNTRDRLGIIPFNIEGVYHGTVAEALSQKSGIAVRNGCFCAQPYIQKLLNISPKEIQSYMDSPDVPRPGMVRISFGLYNNLAEIDTLIQTLKWISKNKSLFKK